MSYHMIVYWQNKAYCHNIYSFFISIRLEKVFTMTHTFFLGIRGRMKLPEHPPRRRQAPAGRSPTGADSTDSFQQVR